jgi:putative DNA primase/helicase
MIHENSDESRKVDTSLVEVSETNPCPHCGKPDWCYLIGELSVCNRDQPPATDWEATSKSDQDGHVFYAPVQEKKAIRPAQTRYWEYPDRNGSRLVRVRRIDNGKNHKKDIKQQHWDKDKNDWVMGLGDVQRASIPIYRYADVQKAIVNGDYIFIVDGEQCADALWDLGLTATTSIGGMGKWRNTDTSDLQEAKVVICPDRDIPGFEDSAKVSEHFPEAQWLYCYPTSPVWDNLPKSQGLDARDWIESYNLSTEDVLNNITPRARTRVNVVHLSQCSNNNYIPDTAPSAAQNFILKAEDALYSDGHYVSIGGLLYRFTGSYYEELNESKDKRRIGGWLKTYSEKVKGAWVKNRADTASVNAVFSWVVNQTAVDPVEVNPGGLNCSNGVVKINHDGSHLLVPHDPKNIYTYVGCKYDPNIDLRDCERLLECLEPSQREIFLRTAAAALNLKLVRSKLTGRGVKGLLCHGEGSNGKDTLRAVLAAVFGRGMTGRSLSDFKSYDMGRKFALAGIEGSICNWASENTAKVDLDNIQSLKQFITGDPIDIERKGKDSYEYKSNAIFFANCNKLPSITGGTSAIDDRYGILRFDKTYVRNAVAAEGQLEADPRFKDDEKFILEQIAPAMLNKLLERLPLLLSQGIDYKATKNAMQKAQEDSHHLWQFVRDAGIEVRTGSRIYVRDLWEQLQEWYQAAGILELEYTEKGKEKLIWHDLSNKYDSPVKAVNQVFARFSEIFPKILKRQHTEGNSLDPRKNQWYLSGIAFVQNPEASEETALLALLPCTERDTALPTALLEEASNAASNATSKATTLTESQSNASNAVLATAADFVKYFAQLPDSERKKLAELLTGVPCSDPLKAFRVGDKVAGNKPENASYNWHGRIIEIHTSINCKVDWEEREKHKGGRVISMLFCDLRKI